MQLSIIIVNYNVKYFLEHCLLSLIQACKYTEAEIIVVDNNSTDGSSTYFENKFTQVKFYWLKENIGFGRANNYALQYAKGEHILFLNPDTIIGELTLKNCLAFFAENKNCGALGVRMIDGQGNFLPESKRGFPKTSVALFKAIGLSKLFPKTFGQYHATHLPEKENSKVDVLAGAFMMLSKNALAITKGFDEDFFMYGEDIDLSYRVKKIGLENYYLGKETIIHFKGESTKGKPKAYFDNFYGAMKLFVAKHSVQSEVVKKTITLGIIIRKNIAILKNNFATASSESVICNALTVGEEIDFGKIKKLLPESTALKICTTEDVKIILQSQKLDTIIFCDSINTSAEIIRLVQEIKNVKFAFYNATSNTIIGSANKASNGFVFTN